MSKQQVLLSGFLWAQRERAKVEEMSKSPWRSLRNAAEGRGAKLRKIVNKLTEIQQREGIPGREHTAILREDRVNVPLERDPEIAQWKRRVNEHQAFLTSRR